MLIRATCLVACLATPLCAADLELVVDRRDYGIELFISLPAADADKVLNTDLSTLDGLTTGVDFSVLQTGTWTQGDALWGEVETSVNKTPVVFEAMSMMVHPAQDALPFRDPIEALTAISVCGVPVPDAPPALETMHLYAGFIAYPEDPQGLLRVDLGNTDAVTVSVRDFSDSFMSQATYNLSPGAVLELPAPTAPNPWRLPLMVLVGLSLLATLGLTAALIRQSKNAPA